jgi:hypothetical protein|tara:strand:- start:6100 stop:6204 length:105 start_codon:yes stop_codon:yes gene_type:complete
MEIVMNPTQITECTDEWLVPKWNIPLLAALNGEE